MVNKPSFIKNHFTWVIAFVCSMLFVFNFWLFWPGYISHDWAYLMTNFNMDNHYPVIYSLSLKFIASIFGFHTYIPLLYNLIPFYLGIFTIVWGLWKKFYSQWCWLGLIPLIIGNIFFNNIILHCSYSSPMFVFLLWATVLYQILNGITYKNTFASIVAFLLALLSRHNAIIQVYPVFFVYAYFIVFKLKPSFRFIKYCGILLLSAGLTVAMAWGFPQLLKQGQSYPSTHIFLHQIAGACVPAHDESCFKSEWYEQGKTYADAEREYLAEPLNADKMSRHWWPDHPFQHKNLKDMRTMWLKAIVKYPYNYWMHINRYIKTMWLNNTQVRVPFAGNNHCLVNTDCEFMKDIYSNNELFYQATPQKIAIYNSLQEALPTIETIWFVILNFILFIVAGIMFIKKRNVLLLYSISSCIAGIAASIIFCAFSPVTDPRYMYPILISTLFALIGFVLSFCSKQTEILFISGKSPGLAATVKKYKYCLLALFIILLAGGIVSYLNRPLTARADVSSAYTENPAFHIKYTEASQPLSEASWMPNGGRRGVVVQKNGKKAAFTIVALQDADIRIDLRGPDVRDSDGNRLKKWVKYTSFKINGKSIKIDNPKVWHDKPFTYILHAKQNNLYQIKLKWRHK